MASGNIASLRAHERSGFTRWGSFEVLHLMGQLMVRLRWPRHVPWVSAYRPDRRLLRTGRGYRSSLTEHLA